MDSAQNRVSKQRAALACVTCKLRKKGCDKKRPRCGYCAQRSLRCEYDMPTRSSKPEPNISSKRKSLLPLAPSGIAYAITTPTGALPTPPEIYPDLCPSGRSPVLAVDPGFDNLLSQTIPPAQLAEPRSLDDLLDRQVHRIISATGLFIDDISVRFFRGMHLWIPIISRVRFQNEILSGRARSGADFSMLLLSMCLITYIPSERSEASALDLRSLYVSTKTLYAHVQAFIPVSTCLIQTGILISLYEYMHGRSDAAFMTIGLCARMAYAAGLHRRISSPPLVDHDAWLKAEEERNVWWAIVIYERMYLCETSAFEQPLSTRFPDIGERLPSEAEVLDHTTPSSHASPPSRLTGRLSSAAATARFGHEAQAGYLLDRVLQVVRHRPLDMQCAELSILDRDLQAFMRVSTTASWDEGVGSLCGSNGIAIRSLLILHHHILDQPTGSDEYLSRMQCSRAALDTASRLVIDVAYYLDKCVTSQNIDTYPPFTLYITRAALGQISKHGNAQDPDFREHRATLTRSLDRYALRWGSSTRVD